MKRCWFMLGKSIVGSLGLGVVLLLSLHITAIATTTTSTVVTAPHNVTISSVTVVLTPTQDNTLYESNSGNFSNGTGTYMFVGNVGNTGGGTSRRGVLAFALTDTIPANATVLSATLQLQMSKTSGGVANVALHRLLAGWGEGTSDAAANEGRGGDATIHDATWLHTFYDTGLWQTPGGDFVPMATATTAVTGNGLYRWSSPSLVADLQQWLETPADNYGWIVVGDESANSTAKRFATREHTVATNRPQLTIVYELSGTTNSTIYLPLVQK